MDPASRARVHVIGGYDQWGMLYAADQRTHDEQRDRLTEGDLVRDELSDPPRLYFVMEDGRRLLIDDLRWLPPYFDVPERFPPRYWSEALLETRAIPGTFVLDDVTIDDVYLGRDDEGEIYLVVPFLLPGGTINDLYYVVKELGEIDHPDGYRVGLEIEASEFLVHLRYYGTLYRWVDRPIAGLDPDRTLLYQG